jgi:hypothetical protein
LIVALGTAAAYGQQVYTTTPAPAAKVIAEVASSSEATVKGAPFSAEVVNETVQTLADGNRIVRRWSSKMYRNSEGRFRREGSITPGAFGMAFSADPNITILDPVGGSRYLLNTEGRTARIITLPSAVIRPLPALPALPPGKFTRVEGKDGDIYLEKNEKGVVELKGSVDTNAAKAQFDAARAQLEAAQVELKAAAAAQPALSASIGVAQMIPAPPKSSKYETRKEDLGTMNVEGVEAQGTRTTTIIPADAIGNERPIEIVYERWYSPELKLVVASRHFDPRFGEQTYRLTNINRSEPDPSLFEVPSDYRILNQPRTPAAPRSPTSQTRVRPSERTVRISTTAATGRP